MGLSLKKLKHLQSWSAQFLDFPRNFPSSLDKWVSGDPFCFFEIIDYGHVNMCYYLGDSHFCPEIPRNKLKHDFHMLVHSASSALSFHRTFHGHGCFHLVKGLDIQPGQISVLIIAYDNSVLWKLGSVLGVMAHACHPSTREAEAETKEQGQPWQHRTSEPWATWAPWDLTLREK